MSYEDKIKELNLELPEARDPVGSYVASKQIGKMLFISGQISIAANGELIKGKVGKDLKTEDGYEAAKRCGLNIISQVKKACGNDLSRVKSCIKLTGFVNSTEDFIEQPKVINGASDLIVSIFGDTGMHTRAAVSTNSLPLGVSVEVDAIFELPPSLLCLGTSRDCNTRRAWFEKQFEQSFSLSLLLVVLFPVQPRRVSSRLLSFLYASHKTQYHREV